MLPAVQAVIRKADTGHLGPIPLQSHGHLPQILRYKRLLKRAHIERRGPIRRVVRQLHVAGEVGTEAVGAGRAHHVLEHGRRGRRVEVKGYGHGVAVGEWSGEGVERGIEGLVVDVRVGEIWAEHVCRRGRIIGRDRCWGAVEDLREWRRRNGVFGCIFGLTLSSRVRFLVTFVENDFGDALEFGTDSQHALDASLFFRHG